MRVQNQQTLVPEDGGLPLHDLSILFNPVTNNEVFTDITNDVYNTEDFQIHQRVSSATSDNGVYAKEKINNEKGIKPESGQSSATASHASSENKLNQEVEEGVVINSNSGLDDRVPVQRSHSSPEMSEGVNDTNNRTDTTTTTIANTSGGDGILSSHVGEALSARSLSPSDQHSSISSSATTTQDSDKLQQRYVFYDKTWLIYV